MKKVFIDIINETIKEYSVDLTYDDIFEEVEKKYIFSNILNVNVNSDKVKEKFLNELLNKKSVQRIVIVGFAAYIRELLPAIKSRVDEIIIFDDYVKQREYRGILITNDETVLKRDNIDSFFITPREHSIKEKFTSRILNKDKIVWSIDIITDIYNKNDIYTSKATDILSEIQKANKPVIFLGGVFSNNFAPMFDA
jgi:hypothetical protein